MNCQVCGGKLENVLTDMPFKIGNNSIVIIKKLPVLQCNNCTEYLIEDSVMKNVDKILDNVNPNVELEILYYAA